MERAQDLMVPRPFRWICIWALTVACSPAGPLPASNTKPLRFPAVVAEDARSTFVERSVLPSPDQPRRVVQAFFSALSHRSTEELSRVVAEDALAFRPNQDPSSAIVAWQRRLDAADYSATDWARVLPIQIFDRTQAQRLEPIRRFHFVPTTNEWLAVVEPPQTPPPRLWGTTIELVLRARDGNLQITKFWEDHTP